MPRDTHYGTTRTPHSRAPSRYPRARAPAYRVDASADSATVAIAKRQNEHTTLAFLHEQRTRLVHELEGLDADIARHERVLANLNSSFAKHSAEKKK
jgi:hypothetical protein